MASSANAGAPQISHEDKDAIDNLREFLKAEFAGADNIPESRILDALKNNKMDLMTAHAELSEEIARSAWDTVPTKEKKKSENKRQDNQELDSSSSVPGGRGRGRGAAPGRGGGRGESWSEGGSARPGGRGGPRWEGGGERRGGGPVAGGDRGRGGLGGRGRAAPPLSSRPPAPARTGTFGEGNKFPDLASGQGARGPSAQMPGVGDVHKPAAQPVAAAAPVRDAPIPQNQWSKGRPRTEDPPKPAEPAPPPAAMQWSSMPTQGSHQPSGSDVTSQLSSVPADGMQGMMSGASSASGTAASVGGVTSSGSTAGSGARNGDVMQQFRSQPGPDSLASDFSSLRFGDSGSQMTKSPHKATAESVQQVGQAPVQPQEMSSFSEQSSAIFPPYGSQVSAGSSAVPSQGFQNQQTPAQNQQAQQSQPSQQAQAQQVQAQQDVYESSTKVATAESQDAYGMGMGGDTSGTRTDAQQQAYNRGSVYPGSSNTAVQGGASAGNAKPAAAGGQQQNLQQQGGEAMMTPNMQQQQLQQQQLSWQQQQQAQQQQQSMMHWNNTAAYGWTPQVFQQMMYMGYNQMPMYGNYPQQQANPMAAGGHSKQGFNAQSNKKQNQQQQQQQQQQYGTTPGYGAGYGAGSNFPGYMAGGDVASTTNQDYYKSQAAAGGAYGGMYPMFNGMQMDSMAGYGMGQQGAGGQGAASGGSMRYGSAMAGAGAGAAGMSGMPGMDAHMMQYGNPSYSQGGGLDEQKNSWGQQ